MGNDDGTAKFSAGRARSNGRAGADRAPKRRCPTCGAPSKTPHHHPHALQEAFWREKAVLELQRALQKAEVRNESVDGVHPRDAR